MDDGCQNSSFTLKCPPGGNRRFGLASANPWGSFWLLLLLMFIGARSFRLAASSSERRGDCWLGPTVEAAAGQQSMRGRLYWPFGDIPRPVSSSSRSSWTAQINWRKTVPCDEGRNKRGGKVYRNRIFKINRSDVVKTQMMCSSRLLVWADCFLSKSHCNQLALPISLSCM